MLVPRRFLLILLVGILGVAAVGSAQTTRVLMVGDSWSFFQWTNQTMRDVFAANGRPDILEEGTNTTISGSTAASWTTTERLQLITDELAVLPDVEVVQITLGGNDFLAGAPDGWYVGISGPARDALIARVRTDIETVVDHVLQLDPDLRVLLSLYDYVNFEDYVFPFDLLYCDDTYTDMNNPTPMQVNEALVLVSAGIAEIANSRPRVAVREHSGLMQYLFGIPNAVPPVPAGTLLPPGDPTYPSPIEAMQLQGDCIHLSPDGYYGVGENLWWSYYYEHFGGLFTDGFESGDLTAWD